jgi:non-ribosomal peptide synthetase component F
MWPRVQQHPQMSAAISLAGAAAAALASDVAYPRDATIHALFRQQAARSGDAVALVSAGVTQTYAELDRQSDHLAAYLHECGVRPGSFVATLLPRAPVAVVAFLGILKAGAAFVPLDPGYPAELLEFIVNDSSPAVVLADASLLLGFGTTPPWSARTVLMNDALANRKSGPGPEPAVDAQDVAYMMYTSGSTGRPKGVLTPHRGVVRLVINNDFARFGADEVFLQLAPLAFDAATLEIWGSLLNGGQLAFIASARPTLDEIVEAIDRFRVTTMWMTAGLST